MKKQHIKYLIISHSFKIIVLCKYDNTLAFSNNSGNTIFKYLTR